MLEKVLCVDDERNILDAYQRSLRKEFDIQVAGGGEEALRMIEANGPYAVIVSDMRMPGMDGVHFLGHARAMAPETVRIMLTGNADQQTAMEAVNEGHIFRFLNKPCPPESLKKSLAAGIQQYRLLRAEKELLEKTLIGSVQVLTDVLSMVNPTAFGKASRVKRLVRQIATALKADSIWQIEVATMLSQIGCITVPEETLLKVYDGRGLTGEELKMLQAHPRVGADLISRIPRLEQVAEIVAFQEKLFNGAGHPHDHKGGSLIPIGARILKVALDFDKLIEAKLSSPEAFKEIKRRSDWYDPRVVDALKTVVVDSDILYDTMYVDVKDLRQDMILADDIMSVNGLLLVAKGQEVTISLQMRLENILQRGGIEEPIKVFVPVATPSYRKDPPQSVIGTEAVV
jgi:response regulator RpfG family c-di-GMP phosphodiesterase